MFKHFSQCIQFNAYKKFEKALGSLTEVSCEFQVCYFSDISRPRTNEKTENIWNSSLLVIQELDYNHYSQIEDFLPFLDDWRFEHADIAIYFGISTDLPVTPKKKMENGIPLIIRCSIFHSQKTYNYVFICINGKGREQKEKRQ